MAAQDPKPASKEMKVTAAMQMLRPEIEETVSEKTPQHEINKTAVIICVFGGIALLFIASR